MLIENDLLAGWLTEKNYSALSQIVQRPSVEENDLQNFWKIASPYLIQRIKMWNGNVVTPLNISSILQPRNTQLKKKTVHSVGYSISRIDFLTSVLNAAESNVAQDILMKLAKFHLAIPLIVQDISESERFIVTLPIIKSIIIKCESNPGKIIENHLFSDMFRLIVSVRLGNSNIGKSTILNQLMRKQHTFSSRAEPGKEFGRPQTLDGMVEMIWLTQDTCADMFWKRVISEHSKQQKSQEVVILANLHGDAIQNIETIKFLATFASSFVVFQMPNYSEETFNLLQGIISTSNVVRVLVNPEHNDEDNYEISTVEWADYETHETLIQVLKDSLTERQFEKSIHAGEELMRSIRRFSRIIEYGTLNCRQVDNIMGFVGKSGCLKIKQYMRDINDIKYNKWSQQLKNLCQMSIKIFCQPLEQAKTSLIHLEMQLSKISNKESLSAQAEVRKAIERLRGAVNATQKMTDEGKLKHDAEIKKARDALQNTMKDVDNITLGQEHFFRILGQIYTKSLTSPELRGLQNIPDLPCHLAELLINGYAIEVLDGDSVEVQSIWIQSIFENVTQRLSTLKVFVISIIGLQSTGKSTLLNALFSCRFPVSAGRCSRGLSMRMIFLDEELSQSHGFQCILLIDSEGLCSPEKMNDKKAIHDDRLIATYAMSISNLTIVNILGEGMTEMTDILQVAIIAMTRLRLGHIRPDILIVQHLQERNLAKINQANSQFCEAINKAFEEIRKNDVEIGSVSADCLDDLVTRIHSKDLFKHFGAFKDGSSVASPPSETYHDDVISLYEMLLKRAKFCEAKMSFEHWSRHFESNWSCVKGENFALNFKNVKMITDFLFIDKKIAKVKEDLDMAIRFHRDAFSKRIRQLVHSLILDKQQVNIDEKRTKLFENFAYWFEGFPSKCIGVNFHFNIHDKISGKCQNKENCKACKTFKESYDNLLRVNDEIDGEQDRLNSLKEHRYRLISVTLKMLEQTFDGSVVRQGYFLEYSQVITKELKRALEERPHGQYSEKETRLFVEKIWSSLRQIAASKEADSALREKIIQAIASEYVGTDTLERFNLPIVLNKSQAGYGSWIRYKIKNANWVKEWLRHSKPKIITEIVKLNKEQICSLKDLITPNEIDWEHVGEKDFALKKVRGIRTGFQKQIKDYEQRFKVKLSDLCKQDLESYTLQQMRNRIIAANEILEKINHTLDREYVKNGVLPGMLDQFKKQVAVEDLLKTNAVRSGKESGIFSADKPLDKELMNNLTDKLSRLIEGVFDNRADNWRTDGLNFEDGMVIEIKICFPDRIKAYENKFGITLHDNFKNQLEIYTMQQMRDKMIDPQIKWNRNNKPSEILEQKYEDYIREIETRLMYGFSAAGEGVLVGRILCNSLKETAVQEVYSLIIKAVKDEPWMQNTEKVRLHYFEKLAEEVAKGDKKRAIQHFLNPKKSIEKWFESEIDLMEDEEKVTKMYEDTIAKKLKEAVQNITICSTKSEIDKIIGNDIKYGDDNYYSKLGRPTNNLDTEIFKSRLLLELEGYPNSAEYQMIDCKFASDDSVTMGRLGCTERCYWCGALCWGSRGHYTGNKAVAHHTCHQPPGLRGTHDIFTNELVAMGCHNWKDTSKVRFGDYTVDGLLWSAAKAKHFNDWKFNVHSITAFDKMMRWFFQELQKDIAKQCKLKPANMEKLEKWGCRNLELESILAVVRSKIYT